MKTFLFLLFFNFLGLALSSAEPAAGGVAQGMSGLINPSDTVSISVHREPDLNTSGQLAKNGTITMPLIKSVKLAGITTAAAEALIKAKLLDGYLVRPEVTVRITKRMVRTVNVDGEVNQPGVFTLPFDQPLTLTQVIAMAGGANDVANIKKVTLRSGATGKVQVVNLKDIIAGRTRDIILQKNDSVWVPEGLF